MDLKLRLVLMVPVSGTLTGPDGPEANVPVHLVPSFAANLALEHMFASTTLSDAAGRFTFPAVASGDYVARAFRLPRAGIRVWLTDQFLWGETTVGVGSAALSGVSLNMRPGVTVTGRIEFSGTAAALRPEQIHGVLYRGFESKWALADGYGNPVMVDVTAAGTFTARGLPPGRHVLQFPNQSSASLPGWYFESATHNGRNLLLSPLVLDTGRVDNVVIRFTDRLTELAGTVRDPRGVPDGLATVVVFPADFRTWIASGMNSLAARAVPVSVAGVYEIDDLAPGDYLVSAIDEELAARWQQTSVLEAIASSATRVTLSAGTRRLDLSTRR